MGLIYVIVNDLSGMLYVGQTLCDRKKRWREHRCAARSSDRARCRIHRAMRKYGLDNFHMEVIDFADDPKTLSQKEIAWIERLRSADPARGYNLTSGGEGATNLAPETRKRIGRLVRERWQDPDNRKRYIETQWTPEKREMNGKRARAYYQTPEGQAALEAQRRRIQILRTCPHCSETMNGRKWQKHVCLLAPPKERRVMPEEERKAKYGYWRGKKQPDDLVVKRTLSLRKRFKESPWFIPSPSPEGWKRIAEKSKFRQSTPEAREESSKRAKNWWATHPEARRKVSERAWSDESRAKARAAAMKRWHPIAKEGG